MGDIDEISGTGDAARQAGEELSNLTSQANQASAAIQGLSGAQKNAENSAEAAAAQERALGALYNQLNQILPGLGSAMEVLASGYKSTAAAAESATVAQEGFIATAGPIAVVVLAIQEAMNLWDNYKNKVQATSEAVSESMKKIEDATRSALDAQIAFNDAMHAGPSAAEQIGNTLNYNNTILDAQAEKQRKNLDQQEQQELQKAQNDAQRDAIRKKYQQENDDLDKNTAAQKIQNEQASLAATQAEEDKENKEISGLTKKFDAATNSNDTGTAKAIKKQIEQLQASAEELHNAEINYQTDLRTQEGLYEVNYGSIPPITSSGSTTTSALSNPPAASRIPPESSTHLQAQQDITMLDQFGEIINSGGTLDKSQSAIATNIVSILEGHVASSKETMAFLTHLTTITGTISEHNNSLTTTLAELEQKLTIIQQQQNNHGP